MARPASPNKIRDQALKAARAAGTEAEMRAAWETLSAQIAAAATGSMQNYRRSEMNYRARVAMLAAIVAGSSAAEAVDKARKEIGLDA